MYVCDPSDYPRMEQVVLCHTANDGYSQFLDSAVLKSAVSPLNPALGLAGVSAEDLNVELCQRTTELRHPGSSHRVWSVHAEDSVLVRVKSDRAAVIVQIALQRTQVEVRALPSHEAHLHPPPRSLSVQHQ